MLRLLLRNTPTICSKVTAGQRLDGPVFKRFLSASETSVALRPFMFAVHPDLFGQFPKERAVNEHSLKQLNEYINQLSGKHKVQPLTLTFYVRWPSVAQSEYGKFRPVQIPLSAQSLREAVKIVLSSCDLPLDYVDTVSIRKPYSNVSTKTAPQMPNDFADYVNSRIITRFYGAHSYTQTPINVRRMARNTVCEWLHKNADRARKHGLHIAHVRTEITKLKELIMQETGAVDIQWQCNWTLPSFRTALRGLLRVCRQHSGDINLTGRTVVFGTDVGVCIQGHVILRHEDVADNWIVILRSLYQYDAILCKIPAAERYLSTLLGNAEIARQPHHPVTMAEDYLRQIRKLSDSIREQISTGGERVRASVDGLQLAVVCATGPLMISQCGQILIPSSCPAFLVIDFINTHAAEAKHIFQEYLKAESSYVEVVQQCYVALGVESLMRDPNVSRSQMESCCRRLLKLRESGILDVDLSLCRLKVAQFYSVMSDGDLCIPWNFEDVV